MPSTITNLFSISKSPMQECDLEQFLKLTMDDGFEQDTFLVLKDIHAEQHVQSHHLLL